MEVKHLGEDGKKVETVRGLLSMIPTELAGRLSVYHSGIVPVCDKNGIFSGICEPLDGKRAIFLVLDGSEVRTGKLGTEFLLGLRIDSPKENPETVLVCKCGLQEFGKEHSRFESVTNFMKKIKQGLIPKPHEIPTTFLKALLA